MNLSKQQMIDLYRRLSSFEATEVLPDNVQKWTDDITNTLTEYLPNTNLAETVERVFIKSWAVFGSMLGGDIKTHVSIEENDELTFAEKVESVKELLRILCADLNAQIELS